MNTNSASIPTNRRKARRSGVTLLAAAALSAGLIGGPLSSLADAGGFPTPELPKFSWPSIPPVPPGPKPVVTIPPNLVLPTFPPFTVPPGPGDLTPPTLPPVTIPPGPGDLTPPTLPPVTVPPGPGDLTTPTVPPVTVPPGPGDLTTPTVPPVTVPPVTVPPVEVPEGGDPVDVESATEERDLAYTGSPAPLLATIGAGILISGLIALMAVRLRRRAA